MTATEDGGERRPNYRELVDHQVAAGAGVGRSPFLLPMPTADDDAGWCAVRCEYTRLAEESGGVFPHFILGSPELPTGKDPEDV